MKRKTVEDITKDDILRFLMEEGRSTGKDKVINEVGEKELAEKTLEELEEKGLVKAVGDKLELTEKGVLAADKVYSRHKAVEDILKQLDTRSHIAAHYIEHLDMEPSEIKKILKGSIMTLSLLEEGSSGRIMAVLDPRPSIVARLYGVGLLPGRWFKVLSKNPGVVIVMVGSEARVASIDSAIAEKVLVIPEK
ncbi:MAG: ferrous iron transport protein A [Desulfurococcales archaeon]|nr:ferrous iron transport protein A [Desulfurococcales archaeon]